MALKVPSKKLRIGLISDELTYHCLLYECDVLKITPFNYLFALRFQRPDFLLVESAWSGLQDKWKFKIASYPEFPERNNDSLVKVVSYARRLGIPTVFWNKEDGVHFDRFIGSAKLFDHIFTVDQNCVSKYRKVVQPNVTVNTLMFPVQPALHSFNGFHFKYNRANFVGSYNSHIHEKRRYWQDLIFESASRTKLGLTAVDRNSDRKSPVYRFPHLQEIEVLPAISHAATAQVYKDYLVSININTIEDSETMYSRRLVEILACGGIAVTNPTCAVDKLFKDYCYVIHNKDEADDLFLRLKHGPSKLDLERAEAGARFVHKHHTWSHRMMEISKVLGL